jgi:hypothetical protein
LIDLPLGIAIGIGEVPKDNALRTQQSHLPGIFGNHEFTQRDFLFGNGVNFDITLERHPLGGSLTKCRQSGGIQSEGGVEGANKKGNKNDSKNGGRNNPHGFSGNVLDNIESGV